MSPGYMGPVRVDGTVARPIGEAGFVLPTAIFLMVILAALAVFMVSLSRTSHLSSALDLQGGRAYQAARAGIEWAAWQTIDPQKLKSVPACPASPATVVLEDALAAFTVEVTCTQTTYVDGADPVTIFQITSTASSGTPGEVDFIQRRIQASFGK